MRNDGSRHLVKLKRTKRVRRKTLGMVLLVLVRTARICLLVLEGACEDDGFSIKLMVLFFLTHRHRCIGEQFANVQVGRGLMVRVNLMFPLAFYRWPLSSLP